MRNIKLAIVMVLMLTAVLSAQIYIGAMEVHFSPEDIDSIVIAHLNRAESTIRLAVYSLTDSIIAKTLIAAHERGVELKVICDKTQAASKFTQFNRLKDNDIKVIRDSESGLMNNKYCIIDESVILTGSFNWAQDATKNNRENLIIIYDCGIVKEFQIDFFYIYTYIKVKPE